MKAVSGPELARLVRARGWSLLRVSGSHHIFGKPGERARLTVPMHGSRTLKVGLQRQLMKVAGLSDADLGR